MHRSGNSLDNPAVRHTVAELSARTCRLRHESKELRIDPCEGSSLHAIVKLRRVYLWKTPLDDAGKARGSPG